MDIRIREFQESDRQALAVLFVVARSSAFSWLSSADYSLADFDAQTDGERVLVATCGEMPVGFAAIWEADSFLHHLYVHPQYQRRGIGRALLLGCQAFFSQAPTLKCLADNDRAKQFYLSQGWRVSGEGSGPDGPYLLMEYRSPDVASSSSAG
ncbi:GNAT family N-acetyltransferase [Neisseriaceae bacterium JH1-16]|nr:GNAT family N-acetyltransferase [Neisseriaceae bacterium JH1-16]